MEIAYLSGAYIPGRGADSVHVMRMCDALAGQGHQVTLHARHGPEPARDDFEFYGTKHAFEIVKHLRPQVRVVGALAFAALVFAHLGRHKRPDLIYAREIYSLRFALPLKLPFVFESHWKPRNRLGHNIEAAYFRDAGFRRLVLISQALSDIYVEEFPWLDRARKLVAHDAADIPNTPASKPLSEGRLQVGYVGGFLPGYGLELLEALARSRPDVAFHVVGGQEAAVRAWRARTTRVTNLKLHGFVSPARLHELYAGFDVVLAPFQSNTAHIRWISPMKLFEYMSFGKAIVCSDFPVMREIIIDKQDGLLVPPDDLASWQLALDELRDPGLRLRLGEAAFQKFSERFTWKRRAHDVLAGIG